MIDWLSDDLMSTLRTWPRSIRGSDPLLHPIPVVVAYKSGMAMGTLLAGLSYSELGLGVREVVGLE